MPNSMPYDDTLIRSMGRLPVIRALLATRMRPLLAHLSHADRDIALDSMALREFRSESHGALAKPRGTR